jgi:dynein heavy chain, axonemal
MISCVGSEQVKFVTELKLEGKVEVYLQDIIQHMRSSLLKIAETSFKAAETMQRKEWLERDPAQITILVNMITWSFKMEECFEKMGKGDVNSLKNYLETSIQLLTDLIKMVQGKLDKSMRQKIMCLITLDAHSRDVIIRLIEENVRKSDEFQW